MEDRPQTQSNKEMSFSWGLIIIGLLTFFFLYKLINWDFLGDEVTVYPVVCSYEVGIEGRCDLPAYTLRYHKYKINADRQEVISWVQDFEPTRLTKCAIVNKTNWNCFYDDESAEFGMNNGAFYSRTYIASETIMELDRKTYYVSKMDSNWIQSQGNILNFILITALF